MPATKAFWWTPAPFMRLLPAFMSGITVGWYSGLPFFWWIGVGCLSFLFLVVYFLLPVSLQYRLHAGAGVGVLLLLVGLGGVLVNLQDIRQQGSWFGHTYAEGQTLVLTLDEQPIEKPRSFKTVAKLQYLLAGKKLVQVSGRVIVYFKKDSLPHGLVYGSRLLVRKPLQPVQNTGNPGAFDYRRYCLFQGITHQVFLSGKEYRLLPGNEGRAFTRLLLRSREAIIGVLRTYIRGRQEQGLAEALLIGYKEDLDKSLVQAYSNTGVVHVIAISGLHLGLIYGLLLLLLKPLKWARVFRFCIIVIGLWAFALLAGAQPSVLRSAVMFSCMALGELISRRSSVFNTLALSAFGLLCYNPYWLWDLGFQLSYSAVGSILLFYGPLYRSVYFPNRAINYVWQMVALTLTAQLLTLPISLFHFHQFPVLFLVTNLLAVPLSSLILLGEIFLCLVAFIPPVATFAGYLLQVGIGWMNAYILRLHGLPFAVWDGFSISAVQVVLLYLVIGGAGYWVLAKSRAALLWSLFGLLVFVGIRSADIIRLQRQQRLVVYHVARHRAIDYFAGRQVYFLGDTALLREGFERNFYLKPARILYRAGNVIPVQSRGLQAGTKEVMFCAGLRYAPQRLPDVVVVSGRTPVFRRMAKPARPTQVVLDATVPPYYRRQWSRWCDSLGWPLHDVQTDGAFVMKW